MADHHIVFTPSGLSGTVATGTTVLDAARRLGVDLDTVCGGRAVCGRCQVTPTTGSFAKWGIDAGAGALGAPGPSEVGYSGRRPLVDGRRLGCVATVEGDAVIDVPPGSQVHRQVVRKDLDIPPVTVDPLFTLCYVELGEFALGDDASHAELVAAAVAAQHGRDRPEIPARLLPSLQAACARGGPVTIAIDDGDRVAAIWPGLVDDAVGVAVDIGSTTLAGHLCSLTRGDVLATAGRMNPQIRFGEDLMSRVSYVMMNPGGDRELTAAVRAALGELIIELVGAAGVAADLVLEVVLVGNPIMHHVALGIDPTGLGQAPFTLTTDRAVAAPARELGIDLPHGRCYAGPCIAGHVGADTAAVVLAEGPHRGDTMQLLVDVGTNAEIVLGDRTRQFAASSPTGPAFEGAQITHGQRATAGAIERVRIDPGTFAARIKVIGVDPWSDEAGFADAVAATGVTGICGSGIIEVVAEMFLAGVIDANGVIRAEPAGDRVVADGRTHTYVLWPAGEAGGGSAITVTQNDVRAVQLAKAALRAGIDLLVEHAGSPTIADIRLAGAFGAHIDPVHAMVLGLVPDCPVDGVRSVGNAAGAGAVQALLSGELRREMEATARRITKIETATEARFQELFVAAMAFPHASAPAPHLAEVVALPEPASPAAAATTRRRRRGVPT